MKLETTYINCFNKILICKSTDTNECKANICSQKCTNSEGSYTCSCYDGYTLNGDKSSCDGKLLSYLNRELTFLKPVLFLFIDHSNDTIR